MVKGLIGVESVATLTSQTSHAARCRRAPFATLKQQTRTRRLGCVTACLQRIRTLMLAKAKAHKEAVLGLGKGLEMWGLGGTVCTECSTFTVFLNRIFIHLERANH